MRQRYSSKVELHLEVGDQRLPLTHTAPTFVILRDDVSVPVGSGIVRVFVDGKLTNASLVRLKKQEGKRLHIVREATDETV